MPHQIAPPSDIVETWLSVINQCEDDHGEELIIELTGGSQLILRVALFTDDWKTDWERFLSNQAIRKENYTLPESVLKFLEWAGSDFSPEHAHRMLVLEEGLYFYCPPNRLYVKNDKFIYSIQWKAGISSKKEVH